MKKLLALLLLAGGCSAPASPAQSAVEAYLKKTLDDPASYQPVRWGKVTPYLKVEADRLQFGQLMAACQIQQDSLMAGIRGEATDAEVAQLQAVAAVGQQRAAVLAKKVDHEAATKDSSRVGLAVHHAFRAKNKMGGVVLDSARFLVMNDGSVTVMRLP